MIQDLLHRASKKGNPFDGPFEYTPKTCMDVFAM